MPFSRIATLARPIALALIVLALAPSARAGAAPEPHKDDLVAQARKEGTVVLYGSMTAPHMEAIAKRFQAKYGITVQTLRMESNALPGRMMTEQRAGTYNADVVDEPGFQIDQLKRHDLLTQFRAPENREMTAGTFDPDGYWSSVFLNTETIAYNPQRLKAAGLKPPTSWQDLTRPEWRGKFVLFNGSYEWYNAMCRALGKDKGDALMRAYTANGVQMINSHQLAENMVEAGEYTAALNTYGYDIARDAANKVSVALVNPDPTIVEIHAIAIVNKAPHPTAARLFERWLLSRETQSWIAASLGRISPRKDVKNNPAIWNPHIRFLISNPADSVNYAEDARSFNQIFGVAG
ncbi:MAG TPA: extracellular solute-binding protein [Candidatus Acidoferrum sp.]|nr:extracellular solute-binding protein [Candidatus Acidoferrum sp.]